MNILLIEPYYSGSHKQWADNYKRYSNHSVRILSLKGQFWKWRMHGGAITLANEFNKMQWRPDLILATDMLDLTIFVSLTRKKIDQIPLAIYFHENQLSYPWSSKDRDVKKKRDWHYGFINYSSALTADRVLFNSNFHMNSFLEALNPFLKNYPDNNELKSVDLIRKKSQVLHIGLDLKKFESIKYQKEKNPVILWNHRWEYDKNPEQFFSVLEKIKKNNYTFSLAILGEKFSKSPEIFERAKSIFKDNIIHWGYAKSFNEYAEWLWKADILPVTSNQEFFGVSVIEAIYCNTWPILPNRLTYPELIPKKYHKMHLYDNKNQLYDKIKKAIIDYKDIRNSNLGTIASKFDWKKMVPEYDNTLSSL